MSETRGDISERLEVHARVDVLVGARHPSGMSSVLRALSERPPGRTCANDVCARDAYVERALAAMQAAPSRRWTVAALARVAGLSRAPFARRFRKATGMSPLRWLTALRLGMAEERLRDEDASLAMVAVELGYSSEFALSKAFKRHFGMAPGRYRRVILMRRAPNLRPVIRAAA